MWTMWKGTGGTDRLHTLGLVGGADDIVGISEVVLLEDGRLEGIAQQLAHGRRCSLSAMRWPSRREGEER